MISLILRSCLYRRVRISSLRSICSVNVAENGRKLKLCCDGEEERRFHGVWLRHNCRCPTCYSPSTNMNIVHLSQVSECTDIAAAAIEGSNVTVKWTHSDHQGVFPIQWLKENDYSNEENRRSKTKYSEPLIAEKIPVSIYDNIISSDEGAYRWMRDLNFYGMALIKNVPKPLDGFKLVSRSFPHLLPYLGETHDINARKIADDIADTEAELHFHQDLLHYEGPPGITVLNCIRNDPCVEGGETVIVDLYPIVQDLRSNHPERFKILTTVPVTFQRKVLGSEEQKDIRVTRYPIQLDRFGRVTAMNWNTYHPEPLCVDEDFVESYYDALTFWSKLIEESEHKLYHRLSSGEILSFNNRRVVHARTKFKLNGGIRHYQGMYVNIDYLRSQFMILSRKIGKKEASANIFMNTI